jgi:hypothetical protein
MLDASILKEMEPVNADEDTSEAFRFEELLEPQESHYIRKMYSTDNVTFEVFANFIDDFKYKGLHHSPLVVLVLIP